MLKKKTNILRKHLLFYLIFTFCLAGGFSSLINAEDTGDLGHGPILYFYVSSSKAIVDNKDVLIDADNLSTVPVKQDNNFYVPLRFLIENLGGQVEYNSRNSTALIKYHENIIKLKAGSNIVNLNGKNIKRVAPSLNFDDKLFVPVKSFGAIIGKTIVISGNMVIVKEADENIDASIINNYKTWFKDSIASLESSHEDLPLPKDLKSIYEGKNVYQDTLNQLKYYNIEYPQITKMFSIGKSVENRDLMVLKIGTGPKKIFINAEHHPREYITTMVVLKQIDSLLNSYENDGKINDINIHNLLNEVSFYFLPLVNPDGVEICTKQDDTWYYNANGIELNSNYDANWKQLLENNHTNGDYPFSEPETQVMKTFNEEFHFDVSIAYHAAGEVIYWYFEQEGAKKNYDNSLANVLRKSTGYEIVSEKSKNSWGMGFKDWVIQKLDRTAFTIEVGKGNLTKALPFSSFNEIWSKNANVPVDIAVAAKRDDITSYSENFHIILDNNLVKISSLKNINGKVYVSLPDAAKMLDANVNQNTLTLNSISSSFEFFNNSRIVKINNMPFVSSAPYLKFDDSGYVSLRTLSDVLGIQLEYDENSKTIYITKNINIPLNSNLDSLFPKSVVNGTITADANLYDNIDGKIVNKVNSGTNVEVLSDRSYKWYNIKESDGTTGWIKSTVISIEPDKAASTDVASKEEIEFYAHYKGFCSSTPYMIWVDLSRQKVNIFTKSDSQWTLLKSYPCATGKNISPTIKGEFKVNNDRGLWMVANKESGVKYYVGFYPRYYFHSIKISNSGSIYDGTLGAHASAGCIRQDVEDSKWIYDNIPAGTGVYIY